MEGVEEEMGLQLHAQGRVVGLREPGLQLGGLELARLEAPVHVHGRVGADGDDEVHEGQVEIAPEEAGELVPEDRLRNRGEPLEQLADGEDRRQPGHRERQAQAEMEDPAGPGAEVPQGIALQGADHHQHHGAPDQMQEDVHRDEPGQVDRALGQDGGIHGGDIAPDQEPSAPIPEPTLMPPDHGKSLSGNEGTARWKGLGMG